MASQVLSSQRIRKEVAELIVGATNGALLDHFGRWPAWRCRSTPAVDLEAKITETLTGQAISPHHEFLAYVEENPNAMWLNVLIQIYG